MGIVDEDLTLIRDVVAEVTEKTLGNIVARQTNWMVGIATKVNQLAQTVTEVRDTMHAETYGVNQENTIVNPVMIPPLRI